MFFNSIAFRDIKQLIIYNAYTLDLTLLCDLEHALHAYIREIELNYYDHCTTVARNIINAFYFVCM